MKTSEQIDASMQITKFLSENVVFREQSYSINNYSRHNGRQITSTVFPNVKKQLEIMVKELFGELNQCLDKLKWSSNVWNVELLRNKYHDCFDGELEFQLFALRVIIRYVKSQIQSFENQDDFSSN